MSAYKKNRISQSLNRSVSPMNERRLAYVSHLKRLLNAKPATDSGLQDSRPLHSHHPIASTRPTKVQLLNQRNMLREDAFHNKRLLEIRRQKRQEIDKIFACTAKQPPRSNFSIRNSKENEQKTFLNEVGLEVNSEILLNKLRSVIFRNENRKKLLREHEMRSSSFEQRRSPHHFKSKE